MTQDRKKIAAHVVAPHNMHTGSHWNNKGYRTRNVQYSKYGIRTLLIGPMRILRKSIWRLYATRRSLVQSYVMHMQLMSFCVL